MGANCCVSARDKSLPRRGIEVSSCRDIRYSPSWSFRWDNRTHVEDIMGGSANFSHNNSHHVGEAKRGGLDTEIEGHYDAGSPMYSFRTPRWRKSPIRIGSSGCSKVAASDHTGESYFSPQVKDFIKSSSTIEGKPSSSIPSIPDQSSSMSPSLSADPASGEACHSADQLARVVSDSRTAAHETLSGNSSPEGTHSFELSICSNDQYVEGSQGGSSDGWSMRTFSELVASSQRERWSFDSENAGPFSGFAVSNTRLSTNSDVDPQTCGVCSKLLKDRSVCSQSFGANYELSVVAVLVCGHVYHAECLEGVTHDNDRYDPFCTVCTKGEKLSLKFVGKGHEKPRSKIPGTSVEDINVKGKAVPEHHKSGKGLMFRESTSMKSYIRRSFSGRYFAVGSSHLVRSVSQNGSTCKKRFWSRYKKN